MPPRFLLVDDEPSIGGLFRRAAEYCGFEVDVTTHAKLFKAAYEASRPDVIGLELCLPDCDGIELMRYLAEMGCEAQIIIVSGCDNQMLNVARRLGEFQGLKIVGAIRKPMPTAEMHKLLQQARIAAEDSVRLVASSNVVRLTCNAQTAGK